SRLVGPAARDADQDHENGKSPHGLHLTSYVAKFARIPTGVEQNLSEFRDGSSAGQPPRSRSEIFAPNVWRGAALAKGFPRLFAAAFRGCREGIRRRTTARDGATRRGDAWRPGPGTRVEFTDENSHC